MAVGTKPGNEVDLGPDVVKALLDEQHPDLAGLDVVFVGEGWDNVTYRLGPDLAVRLPRRELAAHLIEHEARWLPELAPRLPLPVPVPIRRGVPGAGYPWTWSVVEWFDGSPAITHPPSDLHAAAEALGGFFAALHQPAPPDHPPNPYRGVPLVDRYEATRQRLEALGQVVDPRLAGLWDELVETPVWDGPALWLHGDPHPANLLVDGAGALVAVIDFGDITAGDPASDLMSAFALLPANPRRALVEASGRAGDEALWRRARGWALSLGLAYLAASGDDPAFAALAEATLARALDPSS